MKTKLILLALASLALSFSTGCVQTEVQVGDAHFKTTRVLNRTNISKISYDAATKSFSVEGYANEQTEAIVGVANAVAGALKPAAAVAK